jgi:hypothetical protein
VAVACPVVAEAAAAVIVPVAARVRQWNSYAVLFVNEIARRRVIFLGGERVA